MEWFKPFKHLPAGKAHLKKTSSTSRDFNGLVLQKPMTNHEFGRLWDPHRSHFPSRVESEHFRAMIGEVGNLPWCCWMISKTTLKPRSFVISSGLVLILTWISPGIVD